MWSNSRLLFHLRVHEIIYKSSYSPEVVDLWCNSARDFVFLQEWFNNLQMYLWSPTLMIIKIKWLICDVIYDWLITKEILFLLSDNYLLPQLDGSLSRKLSDRSRAKRNTVYTFRWWTVAADRYAFFKEVDEQVKNRRRNCFYFAMMIRCCKQMCVLQRNWWTGREPKEKIFLLCDDDPLL